MKRSKFNLSNYKLLSCDMGELVPLGLTEVLPGDSIQQATNLLCRVSPLLAPVMHPVHARVSHWFVPHRLIWDDFEDFITGGPDGFNASAFPTVSLPSVGVGSLADYLGVPPDSYSTPLDVSALPFRAYALIYNEHFRDQDLQAELPISTASGVDSTTNLALMNANWERDYFTGARPWTQKGPEVSIPLTGNAPVKGIGKANDQYFGVTNQNVWESGNPNPVTYPNATIMDGASATTSYYMRGTAYSGGVPDVYADLSSVSAATINDLRLAFALQRYEEARARYGSRYVEYLRYLGVRSSDARLDRPEYLGGGKQTIQFSEIVQTGPDASPGAEPVGSLKGHGIGAMRSARYRRFFEEHGYIITLLNVKPKTMYAQGLPRTWSRRTKEDFWQRELEHIGQQEVLNRELYTKHTQPNGVFGYADRYAEYRSTESTIAGEYRTTELDFWHMARIFSAEPVLNSSFVTSVPTKRNYAVQTNDVLWIMANHSIQARRQVSGSAKSFIY